MEALTRTFWRRGASLTLHRERTPEGLILVATESGRCRTFLFTSLNRLIAFQVDMEAFLRRTGWTLGDTSLQPSTPVAAKEKRPRLRLTLVEESEVTA